MINRCRIRHMFSVFVVAVQRASFATCFVDRQAYSCLRYGGRRPTSRQMTLEVEQKFQLSKPADLESKLNCLGFVSRGPVTIIDWYFDTHNISLSTRDCWLRFREKAGTGQWELKRGRGHNGTTVYEEIEGDLACSAALLILEESSDNKNPKQPVSEFDVFEVPKIPISDAHGLILFCRLETTRSSWCSGVDESESSGLQVDLDFTNTGHTVGEVETLCDESELETGRKRVQDLVKKLTGEDGSSKSPALGKLEHFLMNNRPDHYAACVASGAIPKQKK